MIQLTEVRQITNKGDIIYIHVCNLMVMAYCGAYVVKDQRNLLN